MNQITTLSLFRFFGFPNKYWAFAQMGLGPGRLRGTPGLQFSKLLGTGAENGFSVKPDFSLYGLLAVWDDEASATRFFGENALYRDYRCHAGAVQTVYMRATAFHGSWDGFSAFQSTGAFDPAAPVAVITRAAIKPRFLAKFWRRVPAVSADIEGRPGLVYAVGIGERPLLQLATFSLWQSGRAMMDYAYRQPLHAEAVKRTRELGWFSEELFARFVPYRVDGSGLFKFFAAEATT